jgi:hypothetical protein
VHTPARVAALAGQHVTQVSLGGWHSACVTRGESKVAIEKAPLCIFLTKQFFVTNPAFAEFAIRR